MMNENDINRAQQIKASFNSLYAILTSGGHKIANVAIVSDVEVVKNTNDLILEITGNTRKVVDGIFINVEGIFYKLSFKVISSHISKGILESYMISHKDRINYPYELFEFCRSGDKVRQARFSNTGGAFLDWYNDGRVTNHELISYDGIWISGKYIRIIKPVPPSLEFNISEVLFEQLNDSNPFTTIGCYRVYVPGTNLKSSDSYYDEYVTINGIIIPEIKLYKSITNDKIIAIDQDDKEFVIYSSKKNISENIA